MTILAEAQDRHIAELDRAAGGTIEPWSCDVTDLYQVLGIVDACVRTFGRIDILVNNIGGSAQGGP